MEYVLQIGLLHLLLVTHAGDAEATWLHSAEVLGVLLLQFFLLPPESVDVVDIGLTVDCFSDEDVEVLNVHELTLKSQSNLSIDLKLRHA